MRQLLKVGLTPRIRRLRIWSKALRGLHISVREAGWFEKAGNEVAHVKLKRAFLKKGGGPSHQLHMMSS